MVQSASFSGFRANLALVYGTYLVGLVAVLALLALLDRFGLPQTVTGLVFFLLAVAPFALIGIHCRTWNAEDYYVAGRRIPPVYTGIAVAADWLSAAPFLGLAGVLFALGHDGLAFVVGLCGGFVLIALLIVPSLRKLGAYTLPDFFAARYGAIARLPAAFVLAVVSFVFLVAQVYAAGLATERLLGIGFAASVFAAVGLLLLCSFLGGAARGGMKALTWTQLPVYALLIAAFMTPIVALSYKHYGLAIPELAHGQALDDIAALERSLLAKGLASASGPAAIKVHSAPFGALDAFNAFALIVCLMIGTASMPHLLMRYAAVPSVKQARTSVGWSLLFVLVIFLSAPAYAALAKLQLYALMEQSVDLRALPEWIYSYGKLGLVRICGADAVDFPTVAAACEETPRHPFLLRHQDFALSSEAAVLAAPEIGGLPYFVVGLVALGALAGALAAADGLLFALGNMFGHDLYHELLDRSASMSRPLIVSRLALVLIAVLAAYAALARPADILTLASWALSLAAAGLFPALLLGIWSKRTNAWGCIAGMMIGFGLALYYIWGTSYAAPNFYETWGQFSNASADAVRRYAELKQAYLNAAPGPAKEAAWRAFDAHARGIANWSGLSNLSAALFALPAGLATTWLVSLITPRPSRAVVELVTDMRRPLGGLTLRAGRRGVAR
jgi:cation/acetate symporter